MKTSVTMNTYFPKYRAHNDYSIIVEPSRKIDLIDNQDVYNYLVQRVYRDEYTKVPYRIVIDNKEYIFDGFMKVNTYEISDEE